MFLRIHVQKLFFANSVENLGICIFGYFLLFSYFELFRYIVINFEKQFQEMMNKFKIKPIRFRVNYTLACSHMLAECQAPMLRF